MRELIVVAVVCALGSMLGPHMVSAGMKRIFSFLIGLAVLIVVFDPIVEVVESVREFPDRIRALLLPETDALEESEQLSTTYAEEVIASRMEEVLVSLLEKQYSVAHDCFAIHVRCFWNSGALEGEVRVVLRSGSPMNPEEVRERMETWCGGWAVFVQEETDEKMVEYSSES